MIKKISLIIVLFCVSFIAFANNDNEYIYLYSPLSCVIKQYYTLQNTSQLDIVELKVRVLIGKTDSVYQKENNLVIKPIPVSYEKEQLGNIYALINIKSIPAGKSADIVITKDTINYGVAYYNSIYDIKADYTDFLKNPENKQYFLPSNGIESDDELFINEVKNLDPDLTEVQKAYLIFCFINKNMTYDTDKMYANTSALSAFKTGRGVCTEFASVFVALCRAAGIPARVVSGFWPRRDFRANVEETINDDDRHAWAEFYVPTVGWVPAELTSILRINHQRAANENQFAAISADSRHIIYSYGLEPEKVTTAMSVTYSYAGEKVIGDALKITKSNTTVTLDLIPNGGE